MSVVKRLTDLIRFFTSLLFKSIFIHGDIAGRHVPTALNLALLTVQLLIARGGVHHMLVVLASITAVYVARDSHKVIRYAAVLALVPTGWYFLASLPFTLSLPGSGLIALRVFTVSLSFLCFFYFLNPVEISTLMKWLGLRKASLYPVFTWRVVPHIMQDAETALLVGEMKRVESWRSLAISVVTTDEYVSLYEEGTYTKPGYDPYFRYDLGHSLITAAILTALLTFHAVV